MKVLRKIIEINEELCDGCGQCVLGCAEGAIQIVDGKARVTDDKFCDGLGACIGECPNDALKIIEREAVEFDEEAVEKHLAAMDKKEHSPERKVPLQPVACQCPSARIMEFPKGEKNVCAGECAPDQSALSNWPVQIHLIPPNAPFLKGADLLVLADCVPVAYPAFHRDILAGKTVMVGCPKLDNAEAYIEKFAAVFKMAGIKSVTVAIMEVPCCSGLLGIVSKGMKKAGKTIPVKQIVIDRKGNKTEHEIA